MCVVLLKHHYSTGLNMGVFVQVKEEYGDDVYGSSINAPIVLYSSDDEDESEEHQSGNVSADESTTAGNGGRIREHKALCYEDVILWVVKNPKEGGRDVLAMEVHLRHHKGADRKPKP